VGLTNANPAAACKRLPNNKDSVAAQLGVKNTFYRAVYLQELDHINEIYKKGQSPTKHGPDQGDYAPKGVGALYVFNVSSPSIRISTVYLHLCTGRSGSKRVGKLYFGTRAKAHTLLYSHLTIYAAKTAVQNKIL
jgi:hypothetical protein